MLRKRPDPNNWSEHPNINDEVHELIDECEWYRVYDIIEAIAGKIRDAPFSYGGEKFETELNEYFFENGIGWKVVDGVLEVRGSEMFEQTVHIAESLLEAQGMPRGYRELRKRGVSVREAWNTSKSAHGPWRLSKTPAQALALPLRYFANLGLPNLAPR